MRDEISDQIRRVSIHAPLAGCDHERVREVDMEILFQSTHPSRGATLR